MGVVAVAKKRIYPKLTEKQQKLVEDNAGLVYQAVADLYKGLYEYEDLVQIGFEGLCLAAIGYNPETGNNFSTYASASIRKQIWRHHQIWVYRKKRDLTREAFSLDEQIASGTEQYGLTHADLLVAPVDVEDQAIADSLMEVVRSIPNERRRNAMLAHIAGMTLTEIGKSMGVTRYRAGQLIDEARRNVRARWGA